MRQKIISSVLLGGIYAVTPNPVLADGLINKQSFSVDYSRTFARHAATDSADITVYNPAGVMKMSDGAHFKMDFIALYKDYSNTVPGFGEMTQDEHYTYLPGLFAVYRQNHWAGFFAFTVPGGGGNVDYARGNATTVALASSLLAATPLDTIESMRLKGKSYHLGYTFGGSYEINDMWSLSGGLRYIDAFVEVDSGISLGLAGQSGMNQDFLVDYEQDADGWSGFFGLNVTPTANLNIGLLYQGNTRLDYDTTIHRDDIDIVSRFAKGREDLPGLIGAGLSYSLFTDLKIDANLTWYLENEATLEGRLAGQGDSYDAALALEYQMNPQWTASLGFKASRIGIDTDSISPEAPELDSDSIAVGGVWHPVENWDISFGGAKVFYDAKTDSRGITYDKDAWGLFVGMQWHLPSH